MRPPWHGDRGPIAVVISARNAAAEIERCIKSVFVASDACASQGTLWIVVVAEACTDDTAELARRAIGPFGEVLVCDAGSASAAGALGAAAVMAHFRATATADVCIAHTDARTQVARNWLRVLVGAHDRLTVHLNIGAQELAADWRS